jgi:hypothetical protein
MNWVSGRMVILECAESIFLTNVVPERPGPTIKIGGSDKVVLGTDSDMLCILFYIVDDLQKLIEY